MSDLDINKIAADLVQRLYKDVASGVSSSVREAISKLLVVFKKDLGIYLTTTISKCSLIKTPIINRDTPTYLFDIYVHTKLRVRTQVFSDDDFIAQLPTLNSVVIVGNAGSGKSMFMRYLFLALCERGFGRIPVFVELRNLNNFGVKELIPFMYYSIVGTGGVISLEQFEAGLKSGAFSIILDGFDEIDVDQRKQIETQILELRTKYPEILLIVSSRPDPENRFGSWSRFHVASVRPMDRTQTIELIKKLDYDQKIKREFVKGLRDGRFDSHESFISNPLLCIMMLVTFAQTGHIPDKQHIFYEQAFDALFFLHDSAKEGVYRRRTYARLPIDEFRNCLSAFCIVSYAKEKFSFSYTELREVIVQALKIEKKEVSHDDFVSDLIESTCLLQIEGTEYSFTHRSFQEYFTAFFLARSPTANLPQLLDQLSKRREDDVTRMAFAMNRHLLEREWILPRLREFKTEASKLDLEENVVGYVHELFGPIALHVEGGKATQFSYQDMPARAVVWFAIVDLYEKHFAQLNKWLRTRQKADQKIVQTIYEKLKARSDSRITSQESKFEKKNRKRSSYQVPLTNSDNSWIGETRLPEYFKRHRKSIETLLASIEEDVQRQRNVLDSLVM